MTTPWYITETPLKEHAEAAEQIMHRLDFLINEDYPPNAVIAIVSTELARYVAAHSIYDDPRDTAKQRAMFISGFRDLFEFMTQHMDEFARDISAKQTH